jgi:hypothetical protein
MENREQQILSEIKSMVASIRSQLEKLDAKMVEFHQAVDPEGFKTESINVIIDDIDILPASVEAEIVEVPLELDVPEETDDDLPFGDLPEEEPQEALQPEATVELEATVESEATVEPEVAVESEEIVEPEESDEPEPEAVEVEQGPEPEPETVRQELPAEEEDDDDLPGFFSVPETVTVAAKASAVAKPTINDAHSTDQAWRKDMPGSPVKDIRSAISLNDRVFFINNLFDEDAQAFVNALSSINAMNSLEEVVEFIIENFPHWNLNSDVVYRFMMAVRRKVN